MKDTIFFKREGNVGIRAFKKDGKLFHTVPTGVYDDKGEMTYKDELISDSLFDARGALSLEEYKHIDSVITSVQTEGDSITTWMKGLSGNVVTLDGLTTMTYYYRIRNNKTVSKASMGLEDDAPSGAVEFSEDGVCLPIEFSDWTYHLRIDGARSYALGRDVAAEDARLAADGVWSGLNYRNANGWGGLKFHGLPVWGFRDMYNFSSSGKALYNKVTRKAWTANWYTATTAQIFADIASMLSSLNSLNIPGPYTLVVADNLRSKFAEPYYELVTVSGQQVVNSVSGVKSLYQKVLGDNSGGVPNVLNISGIRFEPQFSRLPNGTAITSSNASSACVAMLISTNPKYFQVLNYLPLQSFTMDLKGTIATKHRVAAGICPLFRHDWNDNYGAVVLASS